MSCGAINIAIQMKRLEDFVSSQYSVQMNYSSMDLVVLLDRSRPYVDNAYYPAGGSIGSGSSAISYRGFGTVDDPVIAWSNSTILHELTHLVHHKLIGVTIGSTDGWVWAGPQLFTDLENQRKIAYIEGYAHYVPCLIQKETPHMFWDAPQNEYYKFVRYIGHQPTVLQEVNIESGQVGDGNLYPRFDFYTGSVACILWDLSDDSDDDHIATYNYDLIDFTTLDVFGKISYNSPNGCPQKLSHFLHRMWTSNLMNDDDTRDIFRLLCSRRSIPKSLYENYRLSVGPEGMYQSISAAVAASCDGDAILIEAGVYEESLCIEKSIIFEGNSANADEIVVLGSISIDNEQIVDVKSISFSNPEGIGIEIGDSFVSFENVNIENCEGSGIYSSNPEKLKVSSCRIIDNSGSGIESVEIQNPIIADWGIVKRCLIANNDNYGIKSRSPLMIDNCTISSNEHGINNVNHTLINSIICGNDYNISLPATEPSISYSCIGGGYNGNGNIDTDPRFVNSGAGNYNLKWDDQGPSPCIDSGFSGLDGADTDPDGTAIDIGCFYFDHSTTTYEYELLPTERSIFWQCFPVIDNVSRPYGEHWNELGYLFRDHIIVPDPQLRNIDWYYDGQQGSMDYSGQWNNRNHRVSSTEGYKLYFEGVSSIDDVFVRGFRSDPLTTPIALEPFYNGQRLENWVGYFLQNTQNAWQSLSKLIPNDPNNRTYLDYVYQIKAKKWGAIRLKPMVGSPWILEQGDYTLSEGDMLVLELLAGAPEELFWNPTISVAPFVRLDPSSFVFEERLDYTQCYVRLNPNDLPSEIGLYVDDICLGAAVVEDSLVQVNLYMDDIRGDGRLEVVFYYENKGRSLRNEYRVFNQDKMIFEKAELNVSEIKDFAFISYFDGEGLTLVPLVTSLDQNYPNPFNPTTIIKYSLDEPGVVSLDIYNIKGQLVKTLIQGNADKGTHSVVWDGIDHTGNPCSSGVYFYKLRTNSKTLVRKMLMLK